MWRRTDARVLQAVKNWKKAKVAVCFAQGDEEVEAENKSEFESCQGARKKENRGQASITFSRLL
jgi:hypothetical protein